MDAWQTRYPGELAQPSAAQLAALAQHDTRLGRVELVARLTRYFAAADPWLIERRHPLAAFVKQIERYAAAPAGATIAAFANVDYGSYDEGMNRADPEDGS